MECFAKHRFARISPRKARLVVDLVRDKSVLQADRILQHLPKKASLLVRKVLLSAVANIVDQKGRNNVSLEDLRISKAFVDEGPMFKRLMPRAKGRGDQIKKRTSHISLAVSEGREQ